MTNARRRSNSSSHTTNSAAFKTKFETIEPEPVFEEEIHGAPHVTVQPEAEGSLDLEKTSTDGTGSTGSVEEEEVAEKKM